MSPANTKIYGKLYQELADQLDSRFVHVIRELIWIELAIRLGSQGGHQVWDQLGEDHAKT